MAIESSTMQINRKLARSMLRAYTPNSAILKKIDGIIRKSDSFLLTTHIDSDLDGVGSQIGLYYLLKKMKKKCMILNHEDAPELLKEYISPNLVKSIQNYEHNTEHFIRSLKDYFVFILDSSELKRSGKVANSFLKAKCKWATIDHHILPTKNNYCIDSSYAATCELIWDLYRYYKIKIPQEAAIPLYVGIVADSGNFRYSKTSFRTHLAGSELLSYGIDSDLMYRLIYESYSLDRLNLMQKILQNSTADPQLGYIVAEVKEKYKKKLSIKRGDSDGLINQLLAIKEIFIAAIMTKTMDGFLKCSFRSIDHIDVSAIAKKFGGGGHKNAAGCKVEEKYEDTRKKIIKEIKKTLELARS